ncbi:hypothetical protein KCU64_g22, partial [Aureobasidium melanogenum]
MSAPAASTSPVMISAPSNLSSVSGQTATAVSTAMMPLRISTIISFSTSTSVRRTSLVNGRVALQSRNATTSTCVSIFRSTQISVDASSASAAAVQSSTVPLSEPSTTRHDSSKIFPTSTAFLGARHVRRGWREVQTGVVIGASRSRVHRSCKGRQLLHRYEHARGGGFMPTYGFSDVFQHNPGMQLLQGDSSSIPKVAGRKQSQIAKVIFRRAGIDCRT